MIEQDIAWEVVSLGDVEYLRYIYMGVAMLRSSGDLLTLGAIGLLICLLMVGAQGAMSGGKQLPLQNILIAYIVWYVMFMTPPVNVALVDKFTGQTAIVSGVPLGIALPQSLISQLGTGMTNIVETAFSYPGLSDEEFGSALNAIVGLRNLAGIQSDPEVLRFQENAATYLSFCAPFLIKNDSLALQAALNSEDALQAAESQNENTPVPYRNISGEIESISCKNAFITLKTALESDSFIQAANQIQSKSGEGNYHEKLSGAYNTLLHGNLDAGRQMRNIVMMASYNQAIATNQATVTDPSVAAMMEAGIWQRNIQWGADGDWFLRYMRPVVTFVEGFIVALAPAIALLVAAGVGGMLVFFSYLKMSIWIQLWFPLLAIINLYIVMVMGRKVSAVAELANVPPASISGSMELITAASAYLATAGMLVAAVPALAYMIISKSPMAFTHLMGRMQGTDTLDEKIAAPSVVNAPPVMSLQSPYTGSMYGGVRMTGSEGEFGNYSTTYSAGSSVSEAQVEAYRASQGFQNTVSSIVGRNARFEQAWSGAMERAYGSQVLQQEGRNINSNDTNRFTKDLGSTVASSFQLSGREGFQARTDWDPTQLLGSVDQLSGLLKAGDGGPGGAKAAGGAKADRMGKAGGLLKSIMPSMPMSASQASEYLRNMSGDDRQSLAAGLDRTVQSNGNYSWLHGRAMSLAAKGIQSEVGAIGLTETDQQAFQESSAEMLESQRIWQTARESGTQDQIQYSGNMLTLSQMAAQRGTGYVAGLMQTVTDAGLGGLLNANINHARNMGVAGTQGQALAAFWTMTGQGAGIAPMTPEQMAGQQTTARAFPGVVADLRGRPMSQEGPAAVPPQGYGANIQYGSVMSAVHNGLSPERVPGRGETDARVSRVAAGSTDLGAMQGRVESEMAPLHAMRAEAILGGQDRHEQYLSDLHSQRQFVAGEQYDAITQFASSSVPPGPGERFLRDAGSFNESGYVDRSYDFDSHVRQLEDGFPSEGLGAGLAAGYYARHYAPDHADTYESKYSFAVDTLKERGHSEEDIRRMGPMVVMGLNGHTQPTSEAVKGVAEKVMTVDRFRN